MKTSSITYARNIAAIIIFTAGISLSACSSSETETPPAARQAVAAKKTPPNENVPSANTPSAPGHSAADEYSYDPTGKIDPFLPLIADAPARQPSVIQSSRLSKPLTPLQKFDLKDLKLVAVISMHSKASALVQDPSGYGYIVKEGMLIGKNDGVLKKIIGNGIIIEEQILNSLGEPEARISTLTIQHK